MFRSRRRVAVLAAAFAVMTAQVVAPTAVRAEEPAPAFELRVPVLMYHRIACAPPDALYKHNWVCPELLHRQMARLASRGWRTITADALAHALKSRTCLPNKTFVITVDDGALDGYTNGAPIWEKYGFRASFYMVVGKAGDLDHPKKPHFTWDQARDLVARGHLIGNHTWWHRSVSNLDYAGLESQIGAAEDRLGAEGVAHLPRTFVYPYGSTSASAVAYLAARGFDMAFTTKGGGVHSTASPLLSPRLRVRHDTTPRNLNRRMNNFQVPCPPA